MSYSSSTCPLKTVATLGSMRGRGPRSGRGRVATFSKGRYCCYKLLLTLDLYDVFESGDLGYDFVELQVGRDEQAEGYLVGAVAVVFVDVEGTDGHTEL